MEFVTTGTASAQMLLQTTVANSCDYCHIITSSGGVQLYGGKTAYRAGEWNEGYAHGNGCTACHAVHGVSTNYGNAALYGTYGTFQGPLQAKILKTRTKGAGGAGNLGYVWQDETIAIGSAGKADIAANSTNPALKAWAAAQTAQDYTGGGWVSQETIAVDPLNVPLFPSATDAINGTNVRPGTDAEQAQASVFCTFCHQNYGTSSEATVNPDGDKSLFQGPWYALAGTVPNVAGTAGTWANSNTAGGQNMPFKNHPLKSIDGTFTAAGKSSTVPAQVAFAGSETCVSCHDAGVRDTPGFVLESYPHFTPGYFHFTKTAAHVGGTMTYAPPVSDVYLASNAAGIAAAQAFLDDPASYEEAITVADGQCLKCHVNAAETAGVGKSY
jgi:cytochrome c553